MGSIGAPDQKTGSSLTGSQQDIASQIAHFLNNQVGTQVPSYTGQLVAPLNKAQNNLAGQYAAVNPTQTNQQSTQALQPALQGQAAMSYQNVQPQQFANQQAIQSSDLLSQQGTQNYFQQGVMNPLMNAYQTQVAPQIAESFAGGGGSFNSRAGYAQQQALQQLDTQALGQQATAVNSNAQLQAQQQLTAQQATASNNQATNSLNSSNYNTANQMNNQMNYALSTDAMNRQLQASTANESNQAQQISNMNNTLAGASQYQQQQQNVDTSAYQQYLLQQPYNNPYLTTALNFTGQSQQNATSYTPWTSQAIGGLLGQGTSAVGSSLFGSSGSSSGSSIGGLAGTLGGAIGSLFGTSATAGVATEAGIGAEGAADAGGATALGGLSDLFGALA